MKKEITKDMTIAEVLKMDESLGEVFMGFDMHCIYCPMGRMETVEEASMAHGIELDFLLKKLNESLNFSVPGTVKSKTRVKKGTINKK